MKRAVQWIDTIKIVNIFFLWCSVLLSPCHRGNRTMINKVTASDNAKICYKAEILVLYFRPPVQTCVVDSSVSVTNLRYTKFKERIVLVAVI